MDSRPLLLAEAPLGVLLDSTGLQPLLECGDSAATRLLSYRDSTCFEYIRTPGQPKHTAIESVRQYRLNGQEGDSRRSVTFETNQGELICGFSCQADVVDVLAMKLGYLGIGKTDREDMARESCVPLIAGSLNRSGRAFLLVTGNKHLLRERMWLEAHIPGAPINVSTPEEAVEVMDLFAKRQGKFHVASNFCCNKGHWYWLSLRSRLPHYQAGDGVLGSLGTRLVNLLMAIDEIGTQYFLGMDNDTMRGALYHFHYFVVLACGALDNLALEANDKYRLGFEASPHRISLRNDVGKDFLRALRDRNAELLHFVRAHIDLIKLIFFMRNEIIHHNLPRETGYEETTPGREFKANFLWLDAEIEAHARACGDTPRVHDRFSEWGMYEMGRDVLLEPYHFAKSAAADLLAFVDGYLRLLGLPNWIDSDEGSDVADSLRREIKVFRDCRLGY